MKKVLLIFMIGGVLIACRKDKSEPMETDEPKELTLLESITGNYTGTLDRYEQHWFVEEVASCETDKATWDYGDLSLEGTAEVDVNHEAPDIIQIVDENGPGSYYKSASANLTLDSSLTYSSDNYSLVFKGDNNDSLVITTRRIRDLEGYNDINGTKYCYCDIYNASYSLKKK